MIIGISGKLQTGKNTSAHMMQFIIENYKEGLDADSMFASYLLDYDYDFKKTEQKQFASKIKQIVALLINCDVKDLEDESFKNKILSKEWWKYKLPNGQLLAYTDNNPDFIKKYNLIKMTPRLMMQLIGTEGMRDIIHPNIWITSLFNDYKEDSNWLITDCRFPNEAKAIKDRNSILIRVERFCYDSAEDFLVCNSNSELRKIGIQDYNINKTLSLEEITNIAKAHGYVPFSKQHESETALDEYIEWDYVVNNNSTFKELFIKLFEILKNARYI